MYVGLRGNITVAPVPVKSSASIGPAIGRFTRSLEADVKMDLLLSFLEPGRAPSGIGGPARTDLGGDPTRDRPGVVVGPERLVQRSSHAKLSGGLGGGR
jgi:hypothetical protein